MNCYINEHWPLVLYSLYHKRKKKINGNSLVTQVHVMRHSYKVSKSSLWHGCADSLTSLTASIHIIQLRYKRQLAYNELPRHFSVYVQNGCVRVHVWAWRVTPVEHTHWSSRGVKDPHKPNTCSLQMPQADFWVVLTQGTLYWDTHIEHLDEHCGASDRSAALPYTFIWTIFKVCPDTSTALTEILRDLLNWNSILLTLLTAPMRWFLQKLNFSF